MLNRRSAASYVNDDARFTDGIEEAVKAYAASKPWSGTPEEQSDKLTTLHNELCRLSEVECGLQRVPLNVGDRAIMAYVPAAHAIRFAGRISVVTYLYVFAEVLSGLNHDLQMGFAVNLYKRAFPRSFRRADLSGSCVVTRRQRGKRG